MCVWVKVIRETELSFTDKLRIVAPFLGIVR
jgi:hypothetical protein